MDKAVIHYFSGLGSCAKVAKYLAKRMPGLNAKLHSVEDGRLKEDLSKSINIFIFPVYCATVPEIMQDYMRSLQHQNNTPAVILCCYGNISPKRHGWEGAAIFVAAKILKRRGFKVFFTEALPTPANFTQFIPALKEPNIVYIYKETEAALARIAPKIADMQPSLKKVTRFVKFISPLTIAYIVIFRRFLGKMFYASNACVACRRCESNCPSGSIEIKRFKPFWNWNCQGCQRCMNICPTKAINTSVLKLAVYTLACVFPYMWLFGDMCTNVWQVAAVHLGCMLIMLFIADKFFAAVNERKNFSRALSASYTKKYRRFKLDNLDLVSED